MAEGKKENQQLTGSAALEAYRSMGSDASGKLVETLTPSLVKKRRKRRAVLIAFAAASVGIITFSVIAFLGQNFGDFTIKIDPSTTAALALSSTLSPDGDIEKGTSYLDMNGVGNIACTTADMIPTAEYLDADVETGAEQAKLAAIQQESNRLDVGMVDANHTGLNFLYFTFYLKNMSSGPVRFYSNLATTNINEPDNVGVSCTLESLLRVRVFKNTYREGGKLYVDDEAKHEFKTYALPTDAAYTQENVREKEEGTSQEVNYRADNDGLCTNFVKPTDEQSRNKNFTVFNETDEIARYSIVRYTIVFWLEGSDKDTNANHVEEQPRGGSITLAMSFGGVNVDEEGE